MRLTVNCSLSNKLTVAIVKQLYPECEQWIQSSKTSNVFLASVGGVVLSVNWLRTSRARCQFHRLVQACDVKCRFTPAVWSVTLSISHILGHLPDNCEWFAQSFVLYIYIPHKEICQTASSVLLAHAFNSVRMDSCHIKLAFWRLRLLLEYF
jgi:hypothetical protein